MSSDKRDLPGQCPPDDQWIESILGHFKPQPTSRFYQRMLQAPWKSGATSPATPARIRSPRLAWALIISLILLLSSTSLLIPSIRAIARQIIYSFISSPSNQIVVTATLTSPGDLFDFADPLNFSLTVEQVQNQAGFTVKQLVPVPQNLHFVGSQFNAAINSVILLYQDEHYKLFLTQRPLNNSQDVFSIGSDAEVELVKIDGAQGEYVHGGWKAVATQVPVGQNPPNQVNITAVWDSSLPQSTLRWKVGNFSYELRVLGVGGPSQSDLINWANELQ